MSGRLTAFSLILCAIFDSCHLLEFFRKRLQRSGPKQKGTAYYPWRCSWLKSCLRQRFFPQEEILILHGQFAGLHSCAILQNSNRKQGLLARHVNLEIRAPHPRRILTVHSAHSSSIDAWCHRSTRYY